MDHASDNTCPATGVVLTFNSERTVDRTLASLDFCREILVVDSGSTDATLDIARKHGARILERPWPGHVLQHEFARENVATPWLISLDSDEWLDEELKASIQQALADPGNATGFYCNRKSWYFDRYMRHSGWYPDRLLRVARPDAFDIKGADPHQVYVPKGPTDRLAGHVVHHPYAGQHAHVERINTYTTMLAQGMKDKGGRTSLLGAAAHGLGRFLRIYLLKLGFLDGRAGFILAVNGAFYAFHKYLRLLELDVAQADPAQK